MGGKKKTVEKLDYFTSRILTEGWNVSVPFYWPANQPSFIAPFVYNYAGAPEKAQKLIRKTISSIFCNSPGGLPGNDDLGATSAMFLFQVSGMYPLIPGVPQVTFTGSLVDKMEFILDNGSKISLENRKVNTENRTIQSVKVNGKVHDSYFIDLEDAVLGKSDLHIEFLY